MNPLVGGPFAIEMLWLRALSARSTGCLSPIIFLLVGLTLGSTAGAQIQRQDFLIPGVGQLHVREVRDHRHAKLKNLILLHGGGPGAVPSFDLAVAGYSLAAVCCRTPGSTFAQRAAYSNAAGLTQSASKKSKSCRVGDARLPACSVEMNANR
jgi:hypothetical protein